MKQYWDSLSITEQTRLAKSVNSSRGYLRLIFGGHKKAGFHLAKKIEEQTHGMVTKYQLRPDIYANDSGNAA